MIFIYSFLLSWNHFVLKNFVFCTFASCQELVTKKAIIESECIMGRVGVNFFFPLRREIVLWKLGQSPINGGSHVYI